MQIRKNREDDLGLGGRVAPDRGERLVQEDGSFRVRRIGRSWRAVLDLYHRLLVMRWSRLLCLLFAGFLAVNVLFALAYVACGEAAIAGGDPDHGRFARSFFMTVHTFTGVGYGNIVPVSMAANLVMVLESFVGLLSYALATGLIFARFSRPLADFRFSKRVIVAPYRDGRGLMFRIANRRNNLVVGLHARVILSRIERTETMTKRRFEGLALERDEIAYFPLSWTVVHPLDEASPVARWTKNDWEEHDAEIIVMLMGTDETTSQGVHARYSYRPQDVECDVRFRDLFLRHEAGNPTAVDLRLLDDFEPV